MGGKFWEESSGRKVLGRKVHGTVCTIGYKLIRESTVLKREKRES